MELVDKDVPSEKAFEICDDILKSAVEGISDLITTPGIINIDFADIKAIMTDNGSALMGIGIAGGENRAVEAAKAAINSPFLTFQSMVPRVFSSRLQEEATLHFMRSKMQLR